MSEAATFYAVCSARYFPSLVALINSLRLTGHRQELVVGDCGLTDDQRQRISPLCRIFPIPVDASRDPVLFKPFPHLLSPSGVVVIIDSDMIVTGSLEEIIELAADGQICAYADPSIDRHYEQWEQIFDRSGPPRRQPYVSTGFVAFSTARWPALLGQWYEACAQIPEHRTLAQGATYEEPIALGDQDALNALLMSELPGSALQVLPSDERPVWKNEWVQVNDAVHLQCSYRGRPTKLLHADGMQKPWETGAWWRVQKDAYMVLMRRLIEGGDLVVGLRPEEVPIWLRPGGFGGAVLTALDVLHHLATGVLRNTPAGAIKGWLIDRLERRASLSKAA